MSDITISRENDVQIQRFTRPDKKNALTNAMYEAMTGALQSGDEDPNVAVHVFFGSEGNFCAGNDLADFMATAQGTGGPGNGVMDFLKQIPRTKKPMLAGVTGHAVGIGTTLLFHCDLVYASPTARFATPFLDLGLVPEAASSLLFPRLMGYQRAFEMLVLGQAYSAEDAFRAGFVNAVVDDSALQETVLANARNLAAKPPEALRLARELLRGDNSDVVQRTNDEIEAFAKRLKSPEALEAFQAFFEKRPPDFKKNRQRGDVERKHAFPNRPYGKYARQAHSAGTELSGAGIAVVCPAVGRNIVRSRMAWLTRLAREGSEAAGRAGRHGIDVPGPGGRAARILHEIPDAKQNALAAHATPEGHWQFVNAEGKTFTVGTPDEMSRVEHALLPDRRPSTDKPVDLYLSKESLFVNIDNFDVLPPDARLHVVIDGKRYPLHKNTASGKPVLSVEFRKNVRVPVQNRAGFREAIAYLAWPLNQSNIRVLSIREGGVRQLSYAPRRDASGISQVDNVDPKHVREAIATARGKTLLIAGEVNNGVMKFAGGGSPSISLDELRAAARTGDVDLIILHTQAGCQPGGRNWLWQRVGVCGVEEAKKKRVFADFIEALGAERGMYEVTASAESGGRMRLFAQPSHEGRTVVTETSNWVSDAVAKLTGDMVMQAVEVASRNAGEQKERNRRIIPFIPSGPQIAYILGLEVGIGGYPTAAAWWQHIWHRAPRPSEDSRVLYFFAGLPRFIVFFFLFLPLIGVPAVIVHYTLKAWRFVSAPFRWIAAWRRGAEV